MQEADLLSDERLVGLTLEAEFREMFKTAKKFTDKFGPNVIARLGNAPRGDGEANEMLDGFKAVLGQQRFQQFQGQRALASVQK